MIQSPATTAWRLVFMPLVAASLCAHAEPQYPANPIVTESALYLSSEGVSRLDRATQEPVWHALDGVDTFEPVATPEAILVGSSQGVYALAPSSGRLKWHLPSPTSLFSPTVLGRMAYVGGADGSLLKVSVDAGRVLWRRQFSGWIYPPAATSNRLVIGGGSHVLRGLDPKSGDSLWAIQLAQELVYRPVQVGKHLVAATTFAGDMLLVDARDGEVIWTATHEAPVFPPIATQELLIAGTFDGWVKGIDLGTGRLAWEQHLGGQLNRLRPARHGVVTVANDDGEIAIVASATGEVLLRTRQAENATASPIFLDDYLITFSTGRHARPIASPITPTKTTEAKPRKDCMCCSAFWAGSCCLAARAPGRAPRQTQRPSAALTA